MTAPTLLPERGLATSVVGMDEVGRGALAGPVCVGAVLVGSATGTVPEGLRDSKLLSAAARERLVEPVRAWAAGWAVGFAGADEVDAHGIVGALRLAGRRALAGLGTVPDVVLLDGSHDWLSDPMEVGLLAGPEACPPVVTRVKADLTCASVAAASVLAKVARDAVLVALDAEHPHYGFGANKGYASAAHIEALTAHGPCVHHRRSWRLPGVVYRGADDEGAGRER